jgi:hypothetical protein
VLIDHVQELESAAIGGSAELEVHLQHLVGPLKPATPHLTDCGSFPHSLLRSGPLHSFLTPDSLQPLVIDDPVLPSEQAVGQVPAPAVVL